MYPSFGVSFVRSVVFLLFFVVEAAATESLAYMFGFLLDRFWLRQLLETRPVHPITNVQTVQTRFPKSHSNEPGDPPLLAARVPTFANARLPDRRGTSNIRSRR